MLAAIALGSNLHSAFGSPAATLEEALRRLGTLGEITAVSTFHVTAPVGYLDQPCFTNAAALLRTALTPGELLRNLLGIEEAMGRFRSADLPAKGPRIVDLDLLLCQDDAGNSLRSDSPELVLPHPAMHTRRFVLEPLAEIAPALWHPLCRATVAELLSRLSRRRR